MNKKLKLGIKRSIITLFFAATFTVSNAQIKYYSDGRLTFGNTDPYGFYHQTIYGNGMYFKCKTGNFFQIDVTPVGTRLASHSDQVVFYNTQTSTFNDIQVRNVYNYSDARAKGNVVNLKNSLNTVLKLRPVTYNFLDDSSTIQAKAYTTGGDKKEIGLIAQEVEEVLPNVVLTDSEGKKLINYTAIIPVLIEAIQTLQAEVESLKNK
ncbi:MAG: tail fiber domain-containing protein [Prevotella sp.]|nr:tail fiber domain-containing protein [Prevotella sp.]